MIHEINGYSIRLDHVIAVTKARESHPRNVNVDFTVHMSSGLEIAIYSCTKQDRALFMASWEGKQVKLETKYDIDQKVKINVINWPGRITQIKLDGKNLYYGVEYWRDLEPRSCFMNEDEISPIT